MAVEENWTNFTGPRRRFYVGKGKAPSPGIETKTIPVGKFRTVDPGGTQGWISTPPSANQGGQPRYSEEMEVSGRTLPEKPGNLDLADLRAWKRQEPRCRAEESCFWAPHFRAAPTKMSGAAQVGQASSSATRVNRSRGGGLVIPCSG